MHVRPPMQDEADARIAGSDRPTPPAVDQQALIEGPLGPRVGTESPMSIPTTGPVHRVNRSTNRGSGWLFGGLGKRRRGDLHRLGARREKHVVTGRPDGRQWAGPSRGRDPRLRGAISTKQTGLGPQRGRRDAEPGSSRCGIDRVARLTQTRRGRASRHRPPRDRASGSRHSRSRPSKNASFGSGTFATTPACSPSGSGSKGN